MEWERIESLGRLIYWCRRLSDGSFLTVSRCKDGVGGWEWYHRGPNYVRGIPEIQTAAKWYASTRGAKKAADAYVREEEA